MRSSHLPSTVVLAHCPSQRCGGADAGGQGFAEELPRWTSGGMADSFAAVTLRSNWRIRSNSLSSSACVWSLAAPSSNASMRSRASCRALVSSGMSWSPSFADITHAGLRPGSSKRDIFRLYNIVFNVAFGICIDTDSFGRVLISKSGIRHIFLQFVCNETLMRSFRISYE